MQNADAPINRSLSIHDELTFIYTAHDTNHDISYN